MKVLYIICTLCGIIYHLHIVWYYLKPEYSPVCYHWFAQLSHEGQTRPLKGGRHLSCELIFDICPWPGHGPGHGCYYKNQTFVNLPINLGVI